MAEDEPYLIKRYSNRKLYDSVRRRFTTLDEIAALIDSGVRILVRDHDIGTDRTDEVLAQVLRRRVQNKPGSSSLLADLLRAPTEVAGEVVGSVAEQAGLADGAGAAVASAASGRSAGSGASRAAAAPGDGKSGEKKKSGKKSGGKSGKKAKAGDERGDADFDRQEAEIRELRDQVSQLTQAVTLLLKDKAEDKAEEKAAGGAAD